MTHSSGSELKVLREGWSRPSRTAAHVDKFLAGVPGQVHSEGTACGASDGSGELAVRAVARAPTWLVGASPRLPDAARGARP
eukprot:scaffold2911_cov414-Prasinococcus_capsulatus_cf.AAC.20